MVAQSRVVWDRSFTAYDFGPTHPMNPVRLDLTARLCEALGVFDDVELINPDVPGDELLELVMGARVGPRLGTGKLTFVHGYPATQAALARLDPADPRVALRFELYADGIELANGFDELADASEQRARFEADLRERTRRGLPAGPIDERLLGALAAGLPDCVGVAVGFDRVLMVAEGAGCIDSVLPFTLERA